MSTITLADLLATAPAPVHASADAWKAFSDDLDKAADELARGTRDLGYAWPAGTAATAATAKVDTLRKELDAAYNPANRIAQALAHHAAAMTDLRAQAQNVIDDATRRGFTVNVEAATVTAPPTLWQPGPYRFPANQPGPPSDQARQQAQAIVTALGSILAKARGLDDTTATTIAQNLPDPALGFGSLSNLPAVTRDDVLAQRGRDPKAVNEWWRNLTPAQREQAIRDYPDLVGWLDGVPAVDRDAANRIRLDHDRTDLARRAAQLQREIDDLTSGRHKGDADDLSSCVRELDQVNRSLHGLEIVDGKLRDLGPKGLLLGVDPAGDGKAIIAVGNPDTARHTAVWVPGINTDLGDTAGNMKRVVNLQSAADRLTKEPDDVSAIMWLGYDTPETNTSIVTWDRSRAGGKALDSFVDSLRATHEGAAGTITAVGHSYGSTVVAEASLHGDGRTSGLAVDDIVVAGSPGMHTDHASDLNVGAQHVWVGQAPDDPVADENFLTGWGAYGHGDGVAEPAFGANQYTTDTHGHGAYWDYRRPGEPTESLDNQARVIVGQYDRVSLEHGRAPK